jgi:hypothetical protein
MARLSNDEWTEMRAEWEASPRQGLTWLIKASGGRWEITEEAIRRRRAADGWQKRGAMADVVKRAREGADRLSAARPGAADPPSPIPGSEGPEAGVGGAQVGAAPAKNESLAVALEDPAADLRMRLIDTHRQEWRAVRQLVYAAMQEGRNASGFDKAKFAKISTEALRNIQEGERRAWSLDADLIDFNALTDEQLTALAAGKVPK